MANNPVQLPWTGGHLITQKPVMNWAQTVLQIKRVSVFDTVTQALLLRFGGARTSHPGFALGLRLCLN